MDIIFTQTGSGQNCTVISDRKTKLMIDCGVNPKCVSKMCGYVFSDVENCILTHGHFDHSKFTKEIMGRGITIYMSKETKEELSVSGYFVKEVCNMETFRIGTFLIKPFDLPHTNTDGTECKNFGYLIYSLATKERVLFCTDCHYIPYNFPPCDYYFIECNYTESNVKDVNFVDKRRLRSHQSIETALLFLSKQDLSKCKCIYPIHISTKNNLSKKWIKEKIKKSTGKKVVLN